MKNMVEMRAELIDVWQGIRSGKVDINEGIVLAHLGGKIIGSAKAQIDYARARKQRPQIAFLDCAPVITSPATIEHKPVKTIGKAKR
jgi:hypothetical protein